MRRTFLTFCAAATALLALTPAFAQETAYPNKPIHVVFPYPAGSSLEVVGRLVSERASRILGQPIVFENKAGANGILGTTQVARAKPDGYTLALTTTSALLLNSLQRKDLPYDPVRSFTPVIAVADIPVGLIVSSRLPATDLRALVEQLKNQPGQPYASVGIGSFNHLLMEQFKAVAGVDMLHVPYQGAAPIIPELLSGRVDVTVLSVGSVLGQWKAGQVRVLAFMSDKRLASQPGVPTMTEVFPSFRPFGNWMGFVAPANTPEPIVRKLNAAFAQALQLPEVRKKIEEEQWRVMGGSPQDLARLISNDRPMVEAAIKAAGIQPE
ncbi:Bug family tripartite tricarboxylate transporter substrate binding protein [Variovorax boronicumulans]